MSKYAVLPLFLLMPRWALAQVTITSCIVDAESGEPLPLVGVYVSEENNTPRKASVTVWPKEVKNSACCKTGSG